MKLQDKEDISRHLKSLGYSLEQIERMVYKR